MRVAIVRFPGSNCDADTLRAAEAAGADAFYVWHRDRDVGGADAVILPGGFAYGDYLRAGAIARFSEVMTTVQELAGSGVPVLGICNGFQVLCEAGLLPGALAPNAGLRFLSRPVAVRVESTETPFTSAYEAGVVFDVPIAHGEGRYVASPELVEELEHEGRVVLRYATESPNGSVNDIAGIASETRNVVGMMPHPERAASRSAGETAGALVFESLMQAAPLFGGGRP